MAEAESWPSSEGLAGCACPQPTSYILYTTYLSLESPLRCGDCFEPVPLYRLPKTYDDEYYNIIHWQSDYQNCDHLFMNSSVLERPTHRELARWDSALSKQGYAVCRKIEEPTSLPTYYYLHVHYGRSLKAERKRRCPSCDSAWLLNQAWHDRFEFRCDQCRLISSIACQLR